jgi:hypothetical protein
MNCFQLSLNSGEDVDIEYEVDGWYYVSFYDLTVYLTCSLAVNDTFLMG